MNGKTGQDTASSRILCSVIMPVLNEEDNAGTAYETVSSILDDSGCELELICVDDGSTDGTFALLAEITAGDPRVHLIRFTTNFGVHAAVSAGFSVARGDVACIVGADLQEPIDQLPSFLERIRQGDDVVWGVRSARQDPLLTRLTSTLFNRLVQCMAGERPYPDGAGFVVVSRKVLDQLQLFPERSRNVYSLIAWMGFRSSIIECPFGARVHGKSRWTIGKKIKLAIDTIASSSYVPIRLASGLGLLISLLSFLYGAIVVVFALVHGVAVQGWPTMMAAIAFLAGLQLLVAGVMGEYLWRVLYESRGRPLYVIDETRRLSAAEAGRLGGLASSTGAATQPAPSSDLSG